MDMKFKTALSAVRSTLDNMGKAENVKDLDDFSGKAAIQLGLMWFFAEDRDSENALSMAWAERSEIYSKKLDELLRGIKTPEDKIAELESEIDELKDKNKSLNDTIDELRNYNENLEDIIKDAKLDAMM